jgi:Cof subfamily protein (haloacid dehalogenase superfamily)
MSVSVCPYKAVFIDLDGTLLAPEARLTERSIRCLQKLKARGIYAIIATGRPIESVRNIMGGIHESDPVITLSGSMIHTSLYGEPLAAKYIPIDTMKSIVAFCRTLEGVDNILLDETEGFFALKDNPELDEFVGMYNRAPTLFDYDHVPDGPVLSLLVYAKGNRRAVYEQLQEKYAEQVHFTYFREYPWIELSNFDSNKGNALERVCTFLEISPSEVVAIGDGANDLEMIARAGLGIGMTNGDNEVKAIADRLAPHHAEDGVARILEEIFVLGHD